MVRVRGKIINPGSERGSHGGERRDSQLIEGCSCILQTTRTIEEGDGWDLEAAWFDLELGIVCSRVS